MQNFAGKNFVSLDETRISFHLKYKNANICKNLLHIFQCEFRTYLVFIQFTLYKSCITSSLYIFSSKNGKYFQQSWGWGTCHSRLHQNNKNIKVLSKSYTLNKSWCSIASRKLVLWSKSRQNSQNLIWYLDLALKSSSVLLTEKPNLCARASARIITN